MSGKKNKPGVIATAQSRLSSLASTISPFSTNTTSFPFPAFDDLPSVPGQPHGSLWGFFDRAGKKDELGTLNLLTPSLVQSATAEIRTGERIQLDRELAHGQQLGFPGRRPFEQKVIDHSKSSKIVGFDDEVMYNTQGSSQWDGLKHFAHQRSKMYYNGLSHEEATKSETNGIHNWSNAGGIVGRAILVDWARWHTAIYGAPPSPFTRHEIPISEIIATLSYQGTVPKQGDILLIRSGFGAHLDTHALDDPPLTIGVQANEESVRWLYEQHFAAVAGDTLAFEAWPPRLRTGWTLHEWLLVQWGTPIGELWDLEKLSRACEREGRWSFFLSSAPLRVRGGVGSTPNVVAIL